jgi:hypothetical protein
MHGKIHSHAQSEHKDSKPFMKVRKLNYSVAPNAPQRCNRVAQGRITGGHSMKLQMRHGTDCELMAAWQRDNHHKIQ